MSKIEKLEAMPIYGNAYHDMPLFSLAHEIIMSPRCSMATKIRAIKMINKAMGVEGEEATQAHVGEYMNQMKQG